MKAVAQFLFAVSLLVGSQRNVPGADTHHDFARWEGEISAYERMDTTNPPPQGGIEFLGSSTIRQWKTLRQDYPGRPVFNRGFGGSEIVDSTHFADRIVFPYAPREIFFRAGGNDLASGKSPEQVFRDYQDFVALVHAKLPATTLYFISWSPTPLRWKQHEAEQKLNALVADFVRGKPWLKYIEAYDLTLGGDGLPRPELFLADRLHFNSLGYRLLAERVRPFVTNSAAAEGQPSETK